jgi:NAD(P)-dependent dehydrogenase (short-subunit alcohol dehydrogenase family)
MKDFTDKIAVVTGAASGIGRGPALRFAAAGMHVVLADVEAGALEEAAAEVAATGRQALAVRTDASKAADVEALAQATLDRFGAVHVVCNNAGVALSGLTWMHTVADWEWLLGVNLWGVIHGVRAFLPRMLAGGDEGHIVNTASMAGLTTAPFMSVYDVTKHGVVALSESMYKELEATGAPIGVSVVCPGLINTAIMRSSRNRPPELAEEGKAGPMAQAFGQALADRLVSGYPPSEVADQVLRGIRRKRFYIVPAQPEVRQWATVRAQDIIELRNPTPRR